MTKNKKLTIAAVKKENAKFQQRTLVRVNGYTLEIDNLFSPTKISSLIAEIIDKVQYTRIHKYDITEIFTPYVALLMIKHFTSVEIPNKFDEQLAVMNELVDGEFLTTIYEALPKDEVEKVYAEIQKATDRANENLDELKRHADQLELENRELLDLEMDEE